MAEKELERRYKNWCKEAVKGRLPFDTSNGLPVTVCPLFRNVPTTPLVLRTEHGNVLPMPNLASIIRDTAQRIDKNATSLAAGSQPRGEQMLALTVKELSVALAGLGAHALEKNVTHALGLHLLPFTIGRWVYKIHPPEETQMADPTEKLLRDVLQKVRQNERFCHVTIYKSYTGLSLKDTERVNNAQKMLQFKDPEAPLMSVLGADLDRINLEKQNDPNVLGSYLCRTSMIRKIEGTARRALQNFGLFTPEAPVDHILAIRLYEASRVYDPRNRYLIQRFAGRSEPGPIVREFSGILARVKEIVRDHKGMMQITSLLVQLVAKVFRIEDRRDGAKEKGMLHNLRHATAVSQSNELIFFLNAIQANRVEDQRTFAPPVLSQFDLRENSSGEWKPSWAKSLLELEQLTGHDTIEDTKGSDIVTMVGFPFQCSFVLESQPGEGYFYCPHRFSDQKDVIEHVKAVHKGEGLTEEIIMKIAQVDDQLEDSEIGKSLLIVNEVAKVRQLGLDEKDPEILRRKPTLHADVYEMIRIFSNNTRILERLVRDRDEAVKMLQSLDRSTAQGTAAAERQMQLFGVRNRTITDCQKRIFSPSTLASLQETWQIAKSRKAYVTGNMYKVFMESKDQLSILDATVGTEARQYGDKVKAMGGVDPGAIPAGMPGGGIRVGKQNVSGLLAQDLIERSRFISAVQDANEALVAVNRDATINRVASENDIDFGASNVLPAATPLLAAEGWDDEKMEDEIEPPTASETTTMVSTSNPLKRPRPRNDSNKDKGLKAVLEGGAVLSFNEEGFAAVRKIQIGSPAITPVLESVLQVELKRAIRMRGLKGAEKRSAKERDIHTLNMAFHPRIRDEVMSLSLKNALSSGEIRTLMDPFRGKVSVLVLTDPRLIRYPNGVLMRKLCGCVTLIDTVHREFPDDEERLCSVLAAGICKLLQPKFQLSTAGFDLVVRALKCVLLERIGEGRDGNWKVVSSLVEALNGNLYGFWNAAYLRRYHDIQDPCNKTRHVDRSPQKTYAPVDKLPSLNRVIARIKKPKVAHTSPLSVSPSESSAKYSELRAEEVQNLGREVSTALSGHKAELVKIVDSEGLDAKAWIGRLNKGNVNASDNPYAMCTWFRDTKATTSECRDEEKHQWLREAQCCICSELLASAPFEGWCCLSGASFDTILGNALQDVTDPLTRSAHEDYLRQKLVNTIISQPRYPSFHFWHRHCKKADDYRLIVECQAAAVKPGSVVKKPTFDNCPLCCTKYPRDESDLPSMIKLAKKLGAYTLLVKNLVKPNVLQIAAPARSPQPSSADQGIVTMQETNGENTNRDVTGGSDTELHSRPSSAHQGVVTMQETNRENTNRDVTGGSNTALHPGPSSADQGTVMMQETNQENANSDVTGGSNAELHPQQSSTDQAVVTMQGTNRENTNSDVTSGSNAELHPQQSSTDQGVVTMQGTNQENTNTDVTSGSDTELHPAEVARTGVSYCGALFQKDTGCANSPALLIPPPPVAPSPEPLITIYEQENEQANSPDETVTEMEQAVESILPSTAVSTSAMQNPMDIGTVNSLIDLIGPLHEAAMEMTTEEVLDPVGEAILRIVSLADVQDNRLLENIEASALDREVVDNGATIEVVEDPPLEPAATCRPRESFGAKKMGGSGACHQRGCKACVYLMPRTNRIGTRRLDVPIDCGSQNVIYASICQHCQILHGIAIAPGSFREEIRLLIEMSSNRRTLLSRCPVDQAAPILVGLDTYTTKKQGKEKLQAWQDEFKQMATLNLQAI